MSRSGFVVVGCVLLLGCGGLIWMTGDLGIHGSRWFYVVAAVCAVGGVASLVVAWLRPCGLVSSERTDPAVFDVLAISPGGWFSAVLLLAGALLVLVGEAVWTRLRLAKASEDVLDDFGQERPAADHVDPENRSC